MRAYTIKHTGKSIWQNIVFEKELTFADGDKIFCGYLFFRKKDAKKYLESFEYKDFYEVVGLTVDRCEQDNRKR